MFQKANNVPDATMLVLLEKGGGDLMVTKKDLVIAVMATFCLAVSIFMIFPTKSAEPYSPWADVSGPTLGEPDGTINMRDINYEILRFNTFGDTTKNVSVINWPVKRTLNASLADNLVVDGYPHYLEANVEGYSKVTLVLNMVYIEGSPILGVNIRFIVGGVHTPAIFTNNTLTVGRYFLLQSYEVIGPTIEIELDPSGGPMAVSLGIYATD
jgi:hypothetical protein